MSTHGRYSDIARDLTDKIARGDHPVGSLLPTELELCELYGVGRHTVRAAIDQLQGQGMVSRRRKVGTRVEAAAPRSGYSQAIDSITDLVQVAESHVREIQGVRHFVADIALAKRLGLTPGGHYFCVSSIKVESGERRYPLCWTDVYAEQRFAEVVAEAEAHPGELIAALIGKAFAKSIESVDQEVSPVQLTAELSASLKAPSGDLGLNIIRHYRDQAGEIISVSETVYPRDRFTLVMHMTRAQR